MTNTITLEAQPVTKSNILKAKLKLLESDVVNLECSTSSDACDALKGTVSNMPLLWLSDNASHQLMASYIDDSRKAHTFDCSTLFENGQNLSLLLQGGESTRMQVMQHVFACQKTIEYLSDFYDDSVDEINDDEDVVMSSTGQATKALKAQFNLYQAGILNTVVENKAMALEKLNQSNASMPVVIYYDDDEANDLVGLVKLPDNTVIKIDCLSFLNNQGTLDEHQQLLDSISFSALEAKTCVSNMVLSLASEELVAKDINEGRDFDIARTRASLNTPTFLTDSLAVPAALHTNGQRSQGAPRP